MLNENKNPYLTLTQVSDRIKRGIREVFGQGVWIKAEIAKLNVYPKSGHCYPELVEKSEGKILAQIRATIWAEQYKRISVIFASETKQELSEGMTILFFARVDYHQLYGLSVNIVDIDPAFTLGEMYREKTKTIERLKSEGMFDLNRLQEIPDFPMRIAVVSDKTSKGYQDFLQIMHEHALRFKYEITLFPAFLQGDKAVESLLDAFAYIRNSRANFDLVILIRGGGGDIGLHCYDNYDLSLSVATFPLPVITGIGHSTNMTVCEMVSCVNKITPTDVAYHIISYYQNTEKKITNAISALRELRNRLAEEKFQIAHAAKSLQRLVGQVSKNESTRHKSYIRIMNIRLRQKLAENLDYQAKASQRLEKSYNNFSDNIQSNLKETEIQLSANIKAFFEDNKRQLSHYEEVVSLQNPERLLKKGYSLTYQNGKLLKSIGQIKEGDSIKTLLYDGEVTSEIQSKKQK